MIQQRMEKAWDAFKVARDIRDAAQQASDKAFEVWSAMNDELENDDDDDARAEDRVDARAAFFGRTRTP